MRVNEELTAFKKPCIDLSRLFYFVLNNSLHLCNILNLLFFVVFKITTL